MIPAQFPTPPESQALNIATSQFSALANSHRYVHCIVKLGGAAITRKDELETVNDPVLSATTLHLREAMGLSYTNVSMDWSRRNGSSIVDLVPNSTDQHLGFQNPFVVVHGAGSYGHFQASKSGVNKGDLKNPLVKAGFVATRISVTKLNQGVVRSLALEGIPAVGISPFSAGWSTQNKALKRDNVLEVQRAVDAGFVPVVHGDAVLDSTLGCTILSGDVLVSRLAQVIKPNFVNFHTNVPGVFDRSPEQPGATLLREIVVYEDSSWTIVDPPLGIGSNGGVETAVAAHDTTGGMSTKIAEAASIAAMGIDVFIVEAGTPHALEALRGKVKNLKSNKSWTGTLIRNALGQTS
uniref:Isopentenyl phosphate kinase n=1 Tax=Physcomitrium patens TaxID=3218 RepID=A0A7I4FUT5_PHYPA